MSSNIPNNPDVTYFANTNFRGDVKRFGIKRVDRRQHMYVLGKSGTGKSAMLKNMIVQNIKNGEGLAVVDPHGELVEDVLELIPDERKEDVIYFNPADTEFHVGFNVLEVPDPKYKHLIAAGLMSVFTKIWSNVWSARMEYIMNNAILALIDTPGSTMLGIPRLLVDQDYRQKIIDNIKDPVVKAFWTNEYESWQERFRNEAIAPIQNKVGQFLSTSIVRNIVGQAKSTINIFDIMNNKKIFLVNVSKGRIGEDNSALLGAMIITKIQLAAMERVRIPEEERKDFYLYVDEFQNFVTDSFASILSEARKYRLCLCIAHQYIAQLETPESSAVKDAVFGNVGTMAIFRIGAADAEYVESEFTPEFEQEDFVNLPNYHVYLRLMVDGITSRPFSAKTLAPFRIEGSENIAREIVDTSRRIFAQPREKIEEEIHKWSTSQPGFDDEDVADPKNKNDIKNAKPDSKGLYKVKCSIDECGNIATVPFKPEPGRPVYCKEHIEKIKNGEMEPVRQKRPRDDKRTTDAMSALAGIGIAFSQDEIKKKGGSSYKKDSSQKNKPAHKTSSNNRNTNLTPRKKPSQTRKVHIAKKVEKQKPPEDDGRGLQDVLNDVLGKKNTKKKDNSINKSAQNDAENKEPKKPETSISLRDLSSSPKKDTSEQTPRKVDASRAANEDSRNALLAALGNQNKKPADKYRDDMKNSDDKPQVDATQLKRNTVIPQKESTKAEESETKNPTETPSNHNENEQPKDPSVTPQISDKQEKPPLAQDENTDGSTESPEDKALRQIREKMEREQERMKKELEQERNRRERAEREVETHAQRMLNEQRRREQLEAESRENKGRLSEIQSEKKRIESELQEKGTNTEKLAGEKEALAKEQSVLHDENERIKKEHQQAEDKISSIEQEKKKLEEEKNDAQSKAHELEDEKSERERKDDEERRRKEIPEDILKSVLE